MTLTKPEQTYILLVCVIVKQFVAIFSKRRVTRLEDLESDKQSSWVGRGSQERQIVDRHPVTHVTYTKGSVTPLHSV